MARAETRTLVPLDMFAEIMGVNPMHFNGALAPSVADQPMPLVNSRNDLYYQHSWQYADAASREEIAVRLDDAEREIADYLGYDIGLRYQKDEEHVWPRTYRREYWTSGLDLRAERKGLRANFAKIKAAGRRAVTLIDTATVAGAELVYSDADGDGLNETATITVATTITDPTELHVFTASKSGEPEWEIRHPRSVTISGGSVVFVFYSWQLIDPDLWEAFPNIGGATAVDISTDANFVTSVDVYRVYTDYSQASSFFSWEYKCGNCSGEGCEACFSTTQNGCLLLKQPEIGFVTPYPGSYDSDNAIWIEAEWTRYSEPDRVSLWYLAGETDDKFDRSLTNESVNRKLARLACYIAVARLERTISQGGNTETLADYLRHDLAQVSPNPRFNVSYRLLDNPFGTKRGEVIAWTALSKSTKKAAKVAVI